MSRQYVQLWSWVSEFGRQAAVAQDQHRIQLWKIHTTAFDQREIDPEHAWMMFREGVALAERLADVIGFRSPADKVFLHPLPLVVREGVDLRCARSNCSRNASIKGDDDAPCYA